MGPEVLIGGSVKLKAKVRLKAMTVLIKSLQCHRGAKDSISFPSEMTVDGTHGVTD